MSYTESKIRTVLAGVLAGRVSVEQITDDADLIEYYGLDSLQMISLLLGIEDACDIELDYETLELDHLRSVRQFAVFVDGLGRDAVSGGSVAAG